MSIATIHEHVNQTPAREGKSAFAVTHKRKFSRHLFHYTISLSEPQLQQNNMIMERNH